MEITKADFVAGIRRIEAALMHEYTPAQIAGLEEDIFGRELWRLDPDIHGWVWEAVVERLKRWDGTWLPAVPQFVNAIRDVLMGHRMEQPDVVGHTSPDVVRGFLADATARVTRNIAARRLSDAPAEPESDCPF